jgi:hypothetical protein
MSWKQYGGTSNFETNKQVTTNTIVTDEIILKKSFVGGFNIRGVLDVTGSTIIQGDLELTGIFRVNDISVNSLRSNDTRINNITSVNNINCLNNTTVGNILTSKIINVNDITLKNVLYLNGNQFLYSNSSSIGINTLNPTSTFDICCNGIKGLNIQSDFSDNINIISSNYERKGVVISTYEKNNDNTGSNSVIDFYVSKKIDICNNGLYSDAYIQCKDSGNLEIQSVKDIIALSNFHISNRLDKMNQNIFNESLVVYDNSSGIYNYDIYKTNSATGNGITVVSNDNSSNSFLNIVTPNKTGLGIAGGSYPNDTSRSMATIGLNDSSGNFIPNQTIVSSTIKGKYKSTLGINTYKPNTENYVVDINGPLHIDNGDVNKVNTSNFEIISMDSKDNFSIAVGSSIDISNSTYTNIVLISQDYGSSWKNIDLCGNIIIIGGGSTLNDIKNLKLNYSLNSVFVYNQDIAVIVGNFNLILVTIDSGYHWYFIDFFPSIDFVYNFEKVLVSDDADTVNNIILYIYASSSTKNSFLKCYLSKFIDSTQYIQNYSIKDISNNINIRSYDIYYNINDTTKSKVYFTTTNGIWYMDLYNINSNDIKNNNIIQAIDTSSNNFHTIKLINNKIITLSSNATGISYISDSLGISNFQKYSTSFSLKQLYIYDDLHFLSISSNNQLVYSENGGITWKNVPNYFYNASGKEEIVNDISNISQIVMSDHNTILISDVRKKYKQFDQRGNTNIIHLFVPKLFNSVNNSVFDVCGNMNINGSIYVQEGKIASNNSTFYLLNENVDNLNIGSDSTLINIGSNKSGNTNVYTNFYVDKNSVLTGNVLVRGIQTIGNLTESNSISTGALVVQGGVGIFGNTNIGGNLTVNRNSLLVGNVSVTGIQTITNSSESVNVSTGALVVQGGVGIFGNTNIGGNLTVNRNSLLVGNVSVTGIQTITNSSESRNVSTGALVVQGGLGIFGNTNIGGNLTVNRNSLLVGNVSVTGIQTITNSSESRNVSTGALVVNGGVGIFGNTNIGGNLNVNKSTNLIGSVLVNGIQTISNLTESENIYTGALVVQGGVGIFGNTNIGGNLNVSKNTNLIGSVLVDGIQTISNSRESRNVSTGALVVQGGVGIFGNTNIGGNLNVNKNTNLIGSVLVDGIQTISNLTESENIYTGALVLQGGVGIYKNTNIGGNLNVSQNSTFVSDVFVQGIETISNSTESNSISTGALVVSGGVGIYKNTNIGGTLNVSQNSTFVSDVFVQGIENISNSTESNSISTGALVVQGGIGIYKNTNIGGTLNVSQNSTFVGDVLFNGIQTISNSSESYSISDGALVIQGGLGIYGNTNIGTNLNVTKNTNLIGSVLVDGIQTISNSRESNNIFTGALVVSGGVGIFGNTNIGGNMTVNNDSLLIGNVSVTGIQTVTNSSESENISTGALVLNGGVGIFGNTNIGGNLNVNKNTELVGNLSVGGTLIFTNTADSGNVSTGALVVKGGLGIFGNTNIGGNLTVNRESLFIGNVSVTGVQTINNSSESGNVSTGALVVKGGLGIFGNTNIGGNLTVNNDSLFIGNVSVTGIQTINNSSESVNVSTGALVVKGGLGIFRNTNIGGNLNVNNNTVLIGNLTVNSNFIKSISSSGGIYSSKTIETNQDLLFSNYNSISNNIPIVFNDSKYISDVFVRKNRDDLIDDISGQKNFKGIINLQNTTDVSTNHTAALFVSGGVGIQKQLIVNGNIICNSNLSTTGTITTNGIFTANNASILNGTLTTNNTLIANGNIVSWSNIGIGKVNSSLYKLDVLGDININGTIATSSITTNTNILNIAENNQLLNVGIGAKTIRVGTSDTLNNGCFLNIGGGIAINDIGGIDQINIGGTNTKIQINGNVSFANQSTNLTSVIQYSKNFILSNPDSIVAISNLFGVSTPNGGGILFQGFNDVPDNTITNLGQFTVSQDGQGFIFKPPTYNSYVDYSNNIRNADPSQNILRLDVNSLKTTANNGIVVLKPATTDADNSRYTITASNFDIDNIFIKDKNVLGSTTQNISTDVIHKSDVYFNKNIYVNTTTPVTHSLLNINGNAIISKLGIGTSSVNTNPNSLEVQGSFYQMNNGFIYQF